MPFPVGAAILGAATLGAAGFGYFGQKKANKQSQESAREQMAFQERMSSTAMQRAKMDRISAGINPYYALGSGASTPGGAASQFGNEAEGISRSVVAALEIRRMESDLKTAESQRHLLEKQADAAVSTAKQSDAQARFLDTQNLKNRALAPVYNAAGEIVEWVVKDAKSGIKSGYDQIKNAVKSSASKLGQRHKEVTEKMVRGY